MRGERIEIYRGQSGKYFWHWKAANNEITQDSGQGYASHSGARKAAERARRSNPEVPIIEVVLEEEEI